LGELSGVIKGKATGFLYPVSNKKAFMYVDKRDVVCLLPMKQESGEPYFREAPLGG